MLKSSVYSYCPETTAIFDLVLVHFNLLTCQETVMMVTPSFYQVVMIFCQYAAVDASDGGDDDNGDEEVLYIILALMLCGSCYGR